MQNRRSMTIFKTLILLWVSIFAASVQGLQMGEIHSHSKIGEPLDATVDLWLSPSDAAQPMRFKISPDFSYRQNTQLTAIVKRIEARLAQDTNGKHYLRISTDAPVSEPIVAFRLKLFIDDTAIIRHFALALSPPPAAQQGQVSTALNQAQVVAQSAIVGSAYTVTRGDTLWGIARRIGRSSSANIATLAQQIFASNPQAFVNGDRNKLMSGARLILAGTVASSDEAFATKIAQAKPISAEISRSASLHPVAKLASTSSGTQSVASAASGEPIPWQARNLELVAELAALNHRYAQLQTRHNPKSYRAIDATATSAADPDIAAIEVPGHADLQAVAESPSVIPGARPITQKLQSMPPLNDPTDASGAGQELTDGDVVVAGEVQAPNSIFASPQFELIVGAIIALGTLIVIYLITRKIIFTLNKRRAEIQYNAREEDRKAEVARKAKNRIDVESEVKLLLARRDDNNATLKPERKVATATKATHAAENPNAEIDLSIAHGRYEEAENLLRDVITATPRNYSAKLRLIEVYYMTERIDEFCQLAGDLHRVHRADMADEEWRRVIRMGKIIAPDRPPFSGPRAIGAPTQAS